MQFLINLGILIGAIAAFIGSVFLLGGVLKLVGVKEDTRVGVCVIYILLSLFVAYCWSSINGGGGLGDAIEGTGWR